MSILPAGTRRKGTPLDEVALLGRVAAEEMEAFEVLYLTYRPRLLRFIQGMLRQRPLVDEVLDDTMMVVWRKAHTYNHSSKVSTWIFAIAYRQALKALTRPESAPVLDPPESASLAPEPELECQQRELHRQIALALEALSPEHRAVIELTYYLGYSCREIAEIMDCPVDTVKTRMFYARRKLRALLEAREEAI
ncbi:RNA polymerase sigma factor [Dyella subtropica]|uniref:RNA polymerase sigma factor n=1 Tax=Dyella subtropica TaxID=2992127 RepID=UPI0022525EE2|nr:RNA polymerase sigma factor [Dyella subtropica]